MPCIWLNFMIHGYLIELDSTMPQYVLAPDLSHHCYVPIDITLLAPGAHHHTKLLKTWLSGIAVVAHCIWEMDDNRFRCQCSRFQHGSGQFRIVGIFHRLIIFIILLIWTT